MAVLAFAVAPLLPLLALSAQSVETTTLRSPTAEFADPFTRVSGLRELADGRVVVADQQEKRVQIIDFRSGSARAIGREGSGPNEWRLPNALFPLPGDSTLLHDLGNMRYLVIAPDGTPAYTFSLMDPAAMERMGIAPGGPPGAAGGGRSGAAAPRPAPAGDARVTRAPGGRAGNVAGTMVMLRPPAGADRAGRLYFQDAGMIVENGTPRGADSAAITRMHRETRAVDTVATIALPATTVQSSSAGANHTVMVRPAAPFQARQIWAVAPDGRIAVVSPAPYRVEWIAPGGTIPRGPAIDYRPIRVTDADKKEFADRRRNTTAVNVEIGGGGVRVGSGGGAAVPPSPPPIDDADWPATKPPFGANAARVAPNGHLWVLRTRPAGDRLPTYDVFDGAGRVVRRVAMPEGTAIVGFGARSVYLTRRDADDLLYLQRFDVPELLGQR